MESEEPTAGSNNFSYIGLNAFGKKKEIHIPEFADCAVGKFDLKTSIQRRCLPRFVTDETELNSTALNRTNRSKIWGKWFKILLTVQKAIAYRSLKLVHFGVIR